jgi:hypothetical protein
MRKTIVMIAILAWACVILPNYGQAQDKIVNVALSPAEIESMLFLYNQIPVKGSDVELVAPLGVKLRAGLKQARTQKDSTKAIILSLLPAEVQVCVGIINGSTFEAKYAELMLGIKQKMARVMPAPVPLGEKASAPEK